ncbi:MAG: hypothetical protein J1D89_00615 [Agathobacter sp.]|nr:hypothetical protein [Agathobacter sp.]
MVTEEGLFGNFKQCKECGRALSQHYEGDLCPRCIDAGLFREVKEFIRSNNVNEYEVAEHFHIHLKQVKEWIREGRIEYCIDDPSSNVSSLHCQRCGVAVNFGTLCPKCLKLLNGNKGYTSDTPGEDSRMRFLDRGNKT